MTTRDHREIYSIPTIPGIYAFHAGAGRIQSISYVGSSGNLRNRVSQHLEYRDSSIATGASAASLNPDHIHSCTWWTHASFVDKSSREAAELIAFDVLNPTLRSRARPRKESVLRSQDYVFREEMRVLFNDMPSGSAGFPNITTAMSRIEELERRLEELENLTDPGTPT
jgi:hypothetical protein